LIRAQDAPRYRSGGTIKLLRAAGPLNATRHPCAACRRLDPAAAPTPPPGRARCLWQNRRSIEEPPVDLLRLSLLFALTAVAEIVGCYLPWLVVKQGRPCIC
jgi:hypothetical protein